MNWERFGIKIEKQLHTTPLISFSIPLLAILLALLVEGVFLFISGYNPFGVYGVLFKGAFGTWYGLSESIVTAIPLILTGLGVSIAFRMVLWNIGGRGSCTWGRSLPVGWLCLIPMPLLTYCSLPCSWQVSSEELSGVCFPLYPEH